MKNLFFALAFMLIGSLSLATTNVESYETNKIENISAGCTEWQQINPICENTYWLCLDGYYDKDGNFDSGRFISDVIYFNNIKCPNNGYYPETPKGYSPVQP